MPVSSKWSQHFNSMFSAMLYILLTLSLWWRNPSRCGLTTKPLPSHLQGAQSNSNCTKLHIPQSRKKTTRLRVNHKLSHTGICLHVRHTRVSHIQSELNFVRVQYNLLDSHGSESNILHHMHRPPASDALRM